MTPLRNLFAGAVSLSVVANLIAAYAGQSYPPNGGTCILLGWLASLGLNIGALAVVGYRLNDSWKGVLIDGRNRISLSRLQLVLWTIVVISSILSMGIVNSVFESPAPLNLNVPGELWALLGISGTSFVLSPMILANKKSAKGSIDTNGGIGEAGWIDVFSNDDAGMDDTIDFSKVQQLLITVVVVATYAIAIGLVFWRLKLRALNAGEALLTFPAIDAGFIGLLGISQAAYLANKAVDHTKLDAPPPPK
jgi:hypothetical protein